MVYATFSAHLWLVLAQRRARLYLYVRRRVDRVEVARLAAV